MSDIEQEAVPKQEYLEDDSFVETDNTVSVTPNNRIFVNPSFDKSRQGTVKAALGSANSTSFTLASPRSLRTPMSEKRYILSVTCADA